MTARPEPRLKEMHWGAWEGLRISELRRDLGSVMDENEARGLDFRPLGGESPRELQARLRPWLEETGRAKSPIAAVCHNGVIRAVLSLATGWDMKGKPPVKLRDATLHVFRVAVDGTPQLERANVTMEPACHNRT
jgi:probable phosphoglycerate mutase